MTTSTPHLPNAATTPAPRAEDEQIALARGLLAEAIRRCAPTSDAALELCAAWEHLEEPGCPPAVIDVDVPADIPTAELLATARGVLCASILTVHPARRALALASAVRHVTTALTDLSGRRGDGAVAS